MIAELIGIVILLIAASLLVLRLGGDPLRNRLGLSTSPGYLEKIGRTQEAIHQYRTAGNFSAEARLLAGIGRFEEAAKVYIRLQDWEKTTDMFEQMEEWELAALYAKKSHNLDRAIELFRKGNSPLRIADILIEEGHLVRAAHLFAETGNVVKAVRTFEDAGEFTLAREWMAKEYERIGQFERAGLCLLEVGQADAARNLFEKGNCHARIAEMLESDQKWAQSGRKYIQARQFEKAGNMFIKAQSYKWAARAYLQAGKSKEAFQVLSQMEAWFEITKVCLQLGKLDEGRHFLQKIVPSNPDFLESRAFFVNHLLSHEHTSEAILWLEEIIEVYGYSTEVKQQVFLLFELYLKAGEDSKLDIALQHLLAEEHVTDSERRSLGRFQETRERAKSLDNRLENPILNPIVEFLNQPSFERYTLQSELGRGTQGIVYLAKDQTLDRLVVLKILRDEGLKGESARHYFLREAKISASINHPNVVTVYDIGEVDGSPYIAMEYVEGQTLEAYLQKNPGPLPQKTVESILKGICEALETAQKHGVVHRDIKPENMMLTPSGEIKLMDFGLARDWRENPEQSAILVGTPFYMSPEQIIGDPIDHRTDLYSLGIVLYRMMTGQLPFRKGNILRLQRKQIPESPLQLNPQLPAHHAQLVMTLLEKDKLDRPDSARRVLDMYLEHASSELRTEKSSSSVPKSGATRQKNGVPFETDPFADFVTPEIEKTDLSDGSPVEGFELESEESFVPYGSQER